MTVAVELRDVVEGDLPIFFELQRDAVAAQMAAFGTKDPDANEFAARWRKSLTDASTKRKAILVDGALVGFVASFVREEKLQVTYWIARAHWGRGVATEALTQLLRLVPTRPLYASAAKDNAGSLRVLEKCGFRVVGTEPAFATWRAEEVDEVFHELD